MFEKFDKVRRISEEVDLATEAGHVDLKSRYPGDHPDVVSVRDHLAWVGDESPAYLLQTDAEQRLQAALAEYSTEDIGELLGIIFFGRDCNPSRDTDLWKEFGNYRTLGRQSHDTGDIPYLAGKPLAKYIARAERLLLYGTEPVFEADRVNRENEILGETIDETEQS